jgi:hypothetical protein
MLTGRYTGIDCVAGGIVAKRSDIELNVVIEDLRQLLRKLRAVG